MQETFTQNVKDWVDRIRNDHWQQGKVWYTHANQLCRTLSDDTQTPLDSVVGVLAALSPQVSWDVNITSCESIVKDGIIDPGYTGYKINVDKALQCLVSPPLDVLGGRKVIAFYHNILDPTKSQEVTIDTHIGRVLYDNLDLTAKQIRYIFSKTGNELAQEAVRKVAKKLKTIPHVLQASLWVCVRELTQARADKNQLSLYVK